MDLRTTFPIVPSPVRITYEDPVMFIGSCFADSIGSKFETGRMPVLVNPAGTVYNPVSVINTLSVIMEGKIFTADDLYNFNGTWLSFDHNTDFSSDSINDTLDKINRKAEEAGRFLFKARYLFITFGTARVYRWNESGKIVSNCHKIPDSRFTRDLLTPGYIADIWSSQLDKLLSFNHELRVIFTISPVRHWKDGPHGNQVSKSTLFLAVEKLLEHPSGPWYFPAYELVMDDLRDYRFYADDMIHLSQAAIDYLWDKFSTAYFDRDTVETRAEVEKITGAVTHQIRSGSRVSLRSFAGTMLKKIDILNSKKPDIDLSDERKYFEELQRF